MRTGEEGGVGGVGAPKDEHEEAGEAVRVVPFWFFFLVVWDILLTLPEDPMTKKSKQDLYFWPARRANCALLLFHQEFLQKLIQIPLILVFSNKINKHPNRPILTPLLLPGHSPQILMPIIRFALERLLEFYS